MDGTYKGVVDRIVDGETAVILIEEEGDIVEQFDVRADRLPAAAREDGGVVNVTIESDEIVGVDYRAEETRDRREAIRKRLDRLSKRLSDRD